MLMNVQTLKYVIQLQQLLVSTLMVTTGVSARRGTCCPVMAICAKVNLLLQQEYNYSTLQYSLKVSRGGNFAY